MKNDFKIPKNNSMHKNGALLMTMIKAAAAIKFLK